MQSARNHAYDISECFTPDFKGEAIFNEEKAVQLVSARDAEWEAKAAAHDARLLDEAVEKAKAYCKSYGFTFMVDQFLNGLDAAIKGAAHE